MRIKSNTFKGHLLLVGKSLIDQIAAFPEHGIGYSLVDVTLKDDVIVEQVPICNGEFVCFYDDMREFTEDEIASVASSQV